MVPLIILLALYVPLIFASSTPPFGCLNHNRNHVGWWVIYKESGGERYIYKDPHTVLFLSEDRLITDRDSPLVTTVLSSGFRNIENNSNSPFYVAWNDQPSKTVSVSQDFAHAKGFMGIKNTQNNLVESFFIQHSLPRFPLSQYFLFDPNITKRAQHFVCVSMRDEFSGQGGSAQLKDIQIDSVKECNFFKLLWHYARNVNVNFLKNGSELKKLAQINVFKEILLGLPNYPINRSTLDENGVPPQLDLTSFTIESTGNTANRLTFQIFAKSPKYEVDIYDDVTALFSIHHDDFDADSTPETLKTAHLDGKTAMIMIAQSYSDPSTLGINQKVLVDRENYFATVHILNSAGIVLPREDGASEIKESLYRDHSKWSVNVIYGHEGNFPPLLCFYDLNRSTKQVQRGGGAFCLNSSVTGSSPASLDLWELFMSFNPDPNSMARFKNTSVSEILGQVLPKTGFGLESPIPANVLSKTSRFTRTSSSKKRRYSISEEIPVNMVRLADLSRAEYSDGSDLIKIFHPKSIGHSLVPCPYKFSTAASDVKRNGSIPTKMILNIDKAAKHYGVPKLNKALVNYGLQLVATEDLETSTSHSNNLHTPCDSRRKSFNPEFTHNTVVVYRKQQRTEADARQNRLGSFTSPRNVKKKSSPRFYGKSKKSNWIRPYSNPRTIKRIRPNSKKNKIIRESALNEKNFMRSALPSTFKSNEEHGTVDDDEEDLFWFNGNLLNNANNSNRETTDLGSKCDPSA